MVAPSLIPVRSGDRVKTDRRDAMMLAKLHRAGELTAVWVPDAAHEAMERYTCEDSASILICLFRAFSTFSVSMVLNFNQKYKKTVISAGSPAKN